MAFPLEGQSLVLSGRFAGIDSEDARWGLIAKGARVMTSVSKTTSALLAGEDAEAKHLAAAKKHSVPVLGVEALQGLLEGATLASVSSQRVTSTQARPLDGRRAVIVGKPARGSVAALEARLAQLGAEVTKKASANTTLLVLCTPTAHGLDAIAQGIDVLTEADIAALAQGASLAAYLGRRDIVADAPRFVASQLAALRAELIAVDMAGECWPDELTLTLHPDGRVAVALRALVGTPTEDHVRRVIHRADWPRVSTSVTWREAITFGGR